MDLPISKTRSRSKIKRKKDDEHFRRWIAQLPCCITGSREVQCCHIRKGTNTGMSQKPEHIGNCIPLYHLEHARQHQEGEITYWSRFGGIEAAKSLAHELGEAYLLNDTIKALQGIARFRNEIHR